MTDIKRRIKRLEEKTGVKKENQIKAIEVCFAGADCQVKSSFIVNVDYWKTER